MPLPSYRDRWYQPPHLWWERPLNIVLSVAGSIFGLALWIVAGLGAFTNWGGSVGIFGRVLFGGVFLVGLAIVGTVLWDIPSRAKASFAAQDFVTRREPYQCDLCGHLSETRSKAYGHYDRTHSSETEEDRLRKLQESQGR